MAHLIARELDVTGDLTEAVRRAYNRLRGHYAFVAVAADEPGVIVGARKECPLIVGRGDGEQFLASGIPAFLAHTRQVQYIEDDEIVVVRPEGVEFLTAAGESGRPSRSRRSTGTPRRPRRAATRRSCSRRSTSRRTPWPRRSPTAPCARTGSTCRSSTTTLLRSARRIVIVACGTSYHAGLIGRYAIEEWARVPVEMDIASEYRYRNPIVGPGDLVIGITQSGETADTLAAMRLARGRGASVLAVTNIQGSQATRDSDGVLFTRSGLEISVAATKTFTAQVAAMYLLALRMAEVRGEMAAERRRELVSQIKRLPHAIAELLERGSEEVDRVAERFKDARFFLYLGRHAGLPVCLEGALKLKEISYTATDAYAAGEMKHGPIALLDEGTPVVVVATDSPVLEQGRVEHAGGARPRRLRDRRRRRLGGPARRRGAPRARGRLDAAAAAGGDPAAAAGLPDRAAARAQRRPAAQPGQDRHRRVARAGKKKALAGVSRASAAGVRSLRWSSR